MILMGRAKGVSGRASINSDTSGPVDITTPTPSLSSCRVH